LAKKRLKVIVAGSLVKKVLYTPPTVCDTGAARASKRRASSEAQKRMNAKYSYEKLELMLAANFRRGDLVVTLTYDDDHLPAERSGCEQRLKRFRAALNKVRTRKGKRRLVMFWNTEHKHGDGRWHHHAVINSTGADFADIQSCWPHGKVDIKPLRLDRQKNYLSLARYMCKEKPDRVGQRQWSYTRGAAKPEVESYWVDADTVIQAPRGSLVFTDAHERTDYASYHYIRYLAPGWERQRAAAARRRRR
jgi:hypothetical protein